MPSLRLLADDLTGALDTAAEFVGLCGPFDVTWPDALPSKLPSCIAVDTGTRERDNAESIAIVDKLVSTLREGSIAYKKVDSLLRGAWAAELGASACKRGFGPPASSRPPLPIRGAVRGAASNTRARRTAAGRRSATRCWRNSRAAASRRGRGGSIPS